MFNCASSDPEASRAAAAGQDRSATETRNYSGHDKQGATIFYRTEETSDGRVISSQLTGSEGASELPYYEFYVTTGGRILYSLANKLLTLRGLNEPLSVERIMSSKGEALRGRSLGKVQKFFGRQPNWITSVGRDGKSTAFREINNKGDLTGRNIRFNPSDTHHPGEYPYWTGGSNGPRFGRIPGEF